MLKQSYVPKRNLIFSSDLSFLSSNLLLETETANLQARIYDLHNQMCEYELRFKCIRSAASFRSKETRSSFVDGKRLPWKFGDK